MRTCQRCGQTFQTYDGINTCPSCTASVLETLKARGILVQLGGCGCCDGIYAKVFIDGELVIDAQESFHIQSEEITDETY